MAQADYTVCTRYSLCAFVTGLLAILKRQSQIQEVLETTSYYRWSDFRLGFHRGRQRELDEMIRDIRDMIACIDPKLLEKEPREEKCQSSQTPNKP